MSSHHIRNYLNILSGDDFVVHSQSLTESFSALSEGAITDRINATVIGLKNKYNDLSYELLAKATIKAQTMFSGNTEVSALLQKIAKVGKFGMRNRALISVLVGVVSVLIGFANNPSALAKATAGLDQSLDGNTVDDIIKHLEQNGIDVAGEAANAASNLPPELSDVTKKAAQALRAIEKFKFINGQTIDSQREVFQSISVQGELQKVHDSYSQNIVITIPGTDVVLSKMNLHMEDGNFSEESSGAEFDLLKSMKLTPEQDTQVSNYINGISNPEVTLNDKAPGFGALIATAFVKAPDGKFKFSIDSKGIHIRKA
jgi:hypothetical protein